MGMKLNRFVLNLPTTRKEELFRPYAEQLYTPVGLLKFCPKIISLFDIPHHLAKIKTSFSKCDNYIP